MSLFIPRAVSGCWGRRSQNGQPCYGFTADLTQPKDHKCQQKKPTVKVVHVRTGDGSPKDQSGSIYLMILDNFEVQLYTRKIGKFTL